MHISAATLCLALLAGLDAAHRNTEAPPTPAADAPAAKSAALLFEEDLHAGLGKFEPTVDAVENRSKLTPAALGARLQVVAAPDSAPGRLAIRCTVPRQLGSFRSEVKVRHEEGFQERWYGARIHLPADWTLEAESSGDIVMQWHALLEDEKKDSRNFPPLALKIKGKQWVIERSFGALKDIQKVHHPLKEPVKPGCWTSWVFHVRWDSGEEGLVQAWKDGQLAYEAKGPNTYLIKPGTPYFKAGIYHPEWKAKNEEKFNREKTAVKERVLHVADIKVGDKNATAKEVGATP